MVEVVSFEFTETSKCVSTENNDIVKTVTRARKPRGWSVYLWSKGYGDSIFTSKTTAADALASTRCVLCELASLVACVASAALPLLLFFAPDAADTDSASSAVALVAATPPLPLLSRPSMPPWPISQPFETLSPPLPREEGRVHPLLSERPVLHTQL